MQTHKHEIFSKLQKFRKLDRCSRRLLLRAFALLGVMRLAILTRPFKHLVAGLSRHAGVVEQSPLDAESLATAFRVGWAVQTAARFTPWDSTCLVQVLTAQRMLQKLGIAGAFYLGAGKAAAKDETASFAAHAWLMCNDRFITGESGHESYTVVTAFSWP